MIRLYWKGAPPPRSLARTLREAGLAPARGPAPGASLTVVATARGTEAPASPGDAPWIWVSGTRVARAAAEEAALRGAYDSVPVSSPGGAERLVRRLRELLSPEPQVPGDHPIVTATPRMRKVVSQIARAARTSMPVLVTGETGTGKELVARLIHRWSARRERRFVPINCAAIPNELMEAELFGYARGAFSGAVQSYDGLVMAAAGGTVFLDEIDDTPPPIQVKLLRVLEDRVVSRLGESSWREVDFRLVAATNRDLGPLIEAGRFGADLYERLAILSIDLPPLRERIEDLPALVDHFLGRFEESPHEALGGPRVTTASSEALAAMAAYPWPGNIRELRNVVFQAIVEKRGGDEILLSDLPPRILRRGERRDPAGVVDRAAVARKVREGTMNLRREVEALQRIALEAALQAAGGKAARAARLLGEVGRGGASDPGGTVRAMMRRLGVRGRRG